MAFCIHLPLSPPPPPPQHPPLTGTVIFLLMEGVEVVHNWTKFHLDGTCNSGVLIFKSSLSSRKYHFRQLQLVRSTASMVGWSPLLPCVRVRSKAKWFRMTVKKRRFIAFFKLFLFDVKVEILLNSWDFLMAFCIHPPLPPPPPPSSPFNCHPIFLLMQGVEVVHIWTKFHLHGTYNAGVVIF